MSIASLPELAFDGAAARCDDSVKILLDTLASRNHRSSARVCWVVARRED